MAHCVYKAMCDHIRYCSPDPVHAFSRFEYDMMFNQYLALKADTHISTEMNTNGAVTPWIVETIATHFGYAVEVQHSLFTKPLIISAADNEIQAAIASVTDFGQYVDRITLEPAIYLLYGDEHAMFREHVPLVGVPVMALRMVKDV